MQDVFAPDLQSAFRWLSLLVLLAVAGFGVSLYSYGKRRFRLRVLGQMLGPLVALSCTAGAAFVAWDMSRTPTIAIVDDYALFGRDTVLASDIRKAYLEPVSTRNMIGQADVQEIAVVEFADGSPRIFGPGEYDTRALVEALRQLMASATN